MSTIRIFTLTVLVIGILQTTRAIKCYTCLYGPNLQSQNQDASCEGTGDIDNKLLKNCKNTDDICVTFSTQDNALHPNITRRQCAGASIVQGNINSCYNSTTDKFTEVNPLFAQMSGHVEVCTCNSEDCNVPNSKPTNSDVPQPKKENDVKTSDSQSNDNAHQANNANPAPGTANKHTSTQLVSFLFALYLFLIL